MRLTVRTKSILIVWFVWYLVGTLAGTGPICAQTAVRYFANVRAQVATTTYLSGPVRWMASATWFIDDTGHHSESCMLYVLPYSNQLDNGYVEFPGLVNTPGTLGNYCATVAEGSIICLDGRVLSTPTLFSQFVVIDAVRSSGC